jgi:hypothetical protein
MMLMFDPRFTCVCEFVGWENTMEIKHEYN